MTIPMVPSLFDEPEPEPEPAPAPESVGDRLVAWVQARAGVELAPFQRRFMRSAFGPHVHKAVLSGPRGLSKSSMSGWLLAAALDSSGPLHSAGSESILLAGSVDQSRACFSFLKRLCPPGGGFRYMDTAQRLTATNTITRSRVRVMSSSGKRAFGLVGARLVVGDEPASWDERGGRLMYDALETTGGKEATTLILIGTRAPAAPPSWWLDLIDAGSVPGTYVQVHGADMDSAGDVADWDKWKTIKRAHPLIDRNPFLRPKIEAELLAARASEDAKARFLSYRLNVPTRPPAECLFTAPQWQTVEARPPGDITGQPIVGIDMGSSRSWSAAAILWESLRLDVISLCPGIPGVAEQEKRDAVPAGFYQTLVDDGALVVDTGRRVVEVGRLVDAIMPLNPALIVSDRYRLGEVSDAVAGRCRVMGRVARWQEATEDVQRARQVAINDGLSIAPRARRAVRAALAESVVEQDASGNVRIGKARGVRSRQDIVMALTLALGRVPRRSSAGPGYVVA